MPFIFLLLFALILLQTHWPEPPSWLTAEGCAILVGTIAVTSWLDTLNFPPLQVYHYFALDGAYDWVSEQPELRQLNAQVLRTTDRAQQQAVIRQMERHTRDQAYFLFLYNPIQLYAVNNAVHFVPYANGILNLSETSVTDQHWSMRKQKAAGQE